MADWTILWMVEYMWTRLAEAERARENTPVSRQTRANLHFLLSKVGPETLEGWDGALDWRRRAVLDVWRAANEAKSLEGLLRALAAAHALYAADADLAVHVDECSAVLARETSLGELGVMDVNDAFEKAEDVVDEAFTAVSTGRIGRARKESWTQMRMLAFAILSWAPDIIPRRGRMCSECPAYQAALHNRSNLWQVSRAAWLALLEAAPPPYLRAIAGDLSDIVHGRFVLSAVAPALDPAPAPPEVPAPAAPAAPARRVLEPVPTQATEDEPSLTPSPVGSPREAPASPSLLPAGPVPEPDVSHAPRSPPREAVAAAAPAELPETMMEVDVDVEAPQQPAVDMDIPDPETQEADEYTRRLFGPPRPRTEREKRFRTIASRRPPADMVFEEASPIPSMAPTPPPALDESPPPSPQPQQLSLTPTHPRPSLQQRESVAASLSPLPSASLPSLPSMPASLSPLNLASLPNRGLSSPRMPPPSSMPRSPLPPGPASPPRPLGRSPPPQPPPPPAPAAAAASLSLSPMPAGAKRLRVLPSQHSSESQSPKRTSPAHASPPATSTAPPADSSSDSVLVVGSSLSPINMRSRPPVATGSPSPLFAAPGSHSHDRRPDLVDVHSDPERDDAESDDEDKDDDDDDSDGPVVVRRRRVQPPQSPPKPTSKPTPVIDLTTPSQILDDVVVASQAEGWIVDESVIPPSQPPLSLSQTRAVARASPGLDTPATAAADSDNDDTGDSSPRRRRLSKASERGGGHDGGGSGGSEPRLPAAIAKPVQRRLGTTRRRPNPQQLPLRRVGRTVDSRSGSEQENDASDGNDTGGDGNDTGGDGNDTGGDGNDTGGDDEALEVVDAARTSRLPPPLPADVEDCIVWIPSKRVSFTADSDEDDDDDFIGA